MGCKHEYRFVYKTWDCGCDFFYCIYCLERINAKDLIHKKETEQEGSQ